MRENIFKSYSMIRCLSLEKNKTIYSRIKRLPSFKMGKGSEGIFLKRRYTSRQWAHARMFTVSHSGRTVSPLLHAGFLSLCWAGATLPRGLFIVVTSLVLETGSRTWAQQLWCMSFSCSVASGIFPVQGLNYVRCGLRQILIHCTTRDALCFIFLV